MVKKITLASQRRGEPFNYSSMLTGGWQASMFPGGFVFTLRTEIPPSSQLDDTDTIATGGGVVDQATSAVGEITFSDSTNFNILIPTERTRLWLLGPLVWDFKGVISAHNVQPIAYGDIRVFGDVTRSV